MNFPKPWLSTWVQRTKTTFKVLNVVMAIGASLRHGAAELFVGFPYIAIQFGSGVEEFPVIDERPFGAAFLLVGVGELTAQLPIDRCGIGVEPIAGDGIHDQIAVAVDEIGAGAVAALEQFNELIDVEIDVAFGLGAAFFGFGERGGGAVNGAFQTVAIVPGGNDKAGEVVIDLPGWFIDVTLEILEIKTFIVKGAAEELPLAEITVGGILEAFKAV